MFKTVQELADWCEKHLYMFMLSDERDDTCKYVLEFVDESGLISYDDVVGGSFLECVEKAAKLLKANK